MATTEALPSIDLLELDAAADPVPLYEQWRGHGRIVEAGLLQWAALRHVDVRELVRDRRLVHAMPTQYLQYALGEGPYAEFRANGLLNRDGADHHRLRRLMSQALTPQVVADLEPGVRDLAAELAAPLLDGSPGDLVDLLAFPLPATVISRMLGLPDDDADEVRFHAANLFGADRPAADRAVVWFRAYMDRQLAGRVPDEGGDLLARLLAVRDGDDRLSHDEIVDNAILLFAAGFETTQQLIAAAGVHVLTVPERWDRLRADRSLVATTVEELLRFDPAVRHIAFYVALPIAIDGTTLDPGSVVHVVLGMANRDPEVFPDADRFDMARDPNPHVSFGGGAHRCLGLHLARMEAAAVLRALADRFERFEPAGPVETVGGRTCCYERVPIRGRAVGSSGSPATSLDVGR